MKEFAEKIVDWIKNGYIHADVWVDLMTNGNMAPYAPVLMIGASKSEYVPESAEISFSVLIKNVIWHNFDKAL